MKNFQIKKALFTTAIRLFFIASVLIFQAFSFEKNRENGFENAEISNLPEILTNNFAACPDVKIESITNFGIVPALNGYRYVGDFTVKNYGNKVADFGQKLTASKLVVKYSIVRSGTNLKVEAAVKNTGFTGTLAPGQSKTVSLNFYKTGQFNTLKRLIVEANYTPSGIDACDNGNSKTVTLNY